LIQAVSAIANSGKLMRPYLNAEMKPMQVRQVITPDTGKKVTNMMVSAVDKAVIAHIPGYSVAGKTGTAYIPDFSKGGYTGEVINTYVGFAPATDPEFTVLLRLDKPAGAPVAGLTVVPAFRELSEFILNYLNIPPDRPDKQ
jgi:cell division protein FtsI/penicillin-binding protein 2